jgi:hypothetical protein
LGRGRVLSLRQNASRESRFDARVAPETPMASGELMDKIGFGLGLRVEAIF